VILNDGLIIIIAQVIFNLTLAFAKSLTNVRIIVSNIVDFKVKRTIIENRSFSLIRYIINVIL